MKEQVAIVTGSTKGIGKSIAIKLAEQGIKVVITGRNEKQGDEVVRSIEQSGGKAQFFRVDLASNDEVNSFCDQFMKHYGRLDILVNNAGISGPMGPILQTPVESIASTFKVNVDSIFLLCQRLIPMMERQHWGRVVNISSIAYRLTPANSAVYNMTKAALNAFTQTLAKEVGPMGITVNAIAPGLILTDRILNERLPGMAAKAGISVEQMRKELTKGSLTNQLATPENIAATVAFLVTEGASAITGEILNISSGA